VSLSGSWWTEAWSWVFLSVQPCKLGWLPCICQSTTLTHSIQVNAFCWSSNNNSNGQVQSLDRERINGLHLQLLVSLPSVFSQCSMFIFYSRIIWIMNALFYSTKSSTRIAKSRKSNGTKCGSAWSSVRWKSHPECREPVAVVLRGGTRISWVVPSSSQYLVWVYVFCCSTFPVMDMTFVCLYLPRHFTDHCITCIT
jgi:hypothetical protein